MTNTPTQAAIEAAARDDMREATRWAIAAANSVVFHPPEDNEAMFAETALIAFLAAMREAGFVMVPVEPSEAQVDAGMDAYGNDESTSCIYRAMIAARPQIGGE